MQNKKIVFLFLLIFVIIGNVFADDNVGFQLEITGVNVNGGQIHVKVYSNERDYRNDVPFKYFVLESVSTNVIHAFDLPEGEYLIVLFQDTNNNGILDTNFLGIPREPAGISNYRGGIPTGWNRHKFPVNIKSDRIVIPLGRA